MRRQQSMLIRKNKGWILRLQKNREGIDLHLACPFYQDTLEKRINQTACELQKLHFLFKAGISDSKTAFRLQIFSCRLQRLLLGLQNGFSPFY